MKPGQWLAMGLLLVGLPPAGVLLTGGALAPYFEFPPRSQFIAHAPFSWVAFGLIGLLVVVSAAPLVRALVRSRPPAPAPPYRFPWWGWAGVFCGLAAWILAWTRLAWFACLQPHTFPMLWGAFILVVNGLARRRTGSCLLTTRPGAFAALFPVSAAIWWLFEYLNRFVQNWHYSGADYPPGIYFILATLSFATVLPAVLSTRDWLLSFPAVCDVLRGRRLPTVFTSRAAAHAALATAGLGLLLTGAAPNYGFPFLWLAPLLIMLAFQVQTGRCPLLDDACRGRWSRIAAAALAGLVCGFFWEMWNFGSLAHWSYRVPFVDRFHLFAMPLLGYAGYLPFGLECALIGDAILSPGREGIPLDG
jgi:hypothetical protein